MNGERTRWLEELAQELVCRVRDEEPDANARWFEAVIPDWSTLRDLAIILAAAVPTDRSWSHLTGWTVNGDLFDDNPHRQAQRRAVLNASLRTQRERAA